VSVENGRATLALFLVRADHHGLGQHVAHHRRFHFEPEADIFCGVPIMCYIRTFLKGHELRLDFIRSTCRIS